MALPIDQQVADLDPAQATKDFLTMLGLVWDGAAAWEPGDFGFDFTDTIIAWFCDRWNQWIAPTIRAQYLDFASGDALTFAAWARYNRPRNAETFAVGDVVLESRGIFVGTIAVGTIRIQAADGKSYTNASAATMALWMGSGPYTTATVSVRADEAGSGSNALANSLPVYPTTLRAGPGGVYVQTNAALLGTDEEADPLLKKRCALAIQERALSGRGLLEAIALDPIGALRRAKLPIDPTWPATVNVTRVRLDEPGNGVTLAYLMSAGGAASGDTSTPGSDVFICNVAMQSLGLPAGGTLTTAAAAEHAIAYGTITVKVRREVLVTAVAAAATATAALVAFFETLAGGGERLVPGGQGYVLIDHVRAAAMSGPGAFEVTFGGVSVDVALGVNEVAVPTYTVVVSLVTQGT
jgi:hypothetical protein